MKKLEYILSGTSFTRVHAFMDDADTVDSANKIFSKVAEKTNHKFGLLYNAFTEPNFGSNLARFSSLDSIHADSGGLQIITQGLAATPEVKDKIYTNQATYADLGMCFDDIPVQTIGSKSGKNATDNRFFDITGLEAAAKETGRNILRQIEIFHKESSKCKPILIAQGNCYDTYMSWTETILKEIPQDMHQYIGGVAMGGAALGTGSLEDIERAFIFTQLPIEKKHLHILGVGAAKRIFPYLMFIKNGMYDGVSVSYDSTTHSSGLEWGNFFLNGTRLTMGYTYNKVYDLMLEYTQTNFDIDVDPKEYFKIITTPMTKWIDAGGDRKTYFLVRLSTIIGSVINFCEFIDSLLESEKACNNFVDHYKSLAPIQGLIDVKSLDDYNRWKSIMGKYVKTNRVQSHAPTTLEGFF